MLSKVISFVAAAVLISLPCASFAHEGMDGHHHHEMSGEVKRSEVAVNLPDVEVMDQSGQKLKFANEINDGRVVVLNFVYTTCNAICPMTSQIFSKLQAKLGKDLDKVHLVSISIDPEQDTPEKLKEFADRYHASSAWSFYTSTEDNSVAIQKALSAYRGDKMNHAPVTLIKGSSKWIRLDGFAKPDQLLKEVRQELKSK